MINYLIIFIWSYFSVVIFDMLTISLNAKPILLFTIINWMFGFLLALCLLFGSTYFGFCLYWSFQDLPNLLWVHMEEGVAERNRAIVIGQQPTTEEQQWAIEQQRRVTKESQLATTLDEYIQMTTRVRTSLDEHIQTANTGMLVWMVGGVRWCRNAYKHVMSWMIPMGPCS